MRYNTYTLYEAVTNDSVITKSIEDFLQECVLYGSVGMIAYTIDVLKVLKKRVDFGQKILLEREDMVLNKENFADYIKGNFTEYVSKTVLEEE